MAVQITPDRPRQTWTGTPTAEQAAANARGYTAYWGTYTIDEKAQTVTHHRQGAIDGGEVNFVRKFELKDGGARIVLTPVNGGTTTPPQHLTWDRVK